MRVFLAVQIPSQTMIRMFKDYCNDEDGGHPEDYEPMIEIFVKVDRLVDIINVICRDLNVESTDCPHHKHIYELFSILQLFEEWNEDTGGLTYR